MKILVVYCHPRPESFCHAMLEAACGALAAAGHELTIRDLYDEGFRPALSAEEHARYEDEGRNLSGVEDHVAELQAAEGVLLVYPTWWYGMPAMIKGWLDRVWLPGVVFHIDARGRLTDHALSGIRRFMVVTTHGSPWWWIRLCLGDPGHRAVERGLRPLLSARCRTRRLAMYALDASTPAQRAAFLGRVARGMRFFG